MDPPCEKSGLTPEGDCRDSVSLAGVSLRLLVKGPFLVLARGLWLEGQGRFFAITGRRERGRRPCGAFHVSEQVATHGGGQ